MRAVVAVLCLLSSAAAFVVQPTQRVAAQVVPRSAAPTCQFGTGNYKEEGSKNTLLSPIAGASKVGQSRDRVPPHPLARPAKHTHTAAATARQICSAHGFSSE